MHALTTTGPAGFANLGSKSDQLVDGAAVEIDQGRRVEAQPVSPVPAGPPGRRLQDKTGPHVNRRLHVTQVVGAERRHAFRIAEQGKCRKVRQVESLTEDQIRLHPAIREEESRIARVAEGCSGTSPRALPQIRSGGTADLRLGPGTHVRGVLADVRKLVLPHPVFFEMHGLQPLTLA